MKNGDVVLVKFPFANLADAKKRPALVLNQVPVNKQDALVTIAMITSKLDGLELEGDVLLREWQQAHLLHPSLVRFSKVATIDSELVDKQLGSLSSEDEKRVRREFKRLFADWI